MNLLLLLIINLLLSIQWRNRWITVFEKDRDYDKFLRRFKREGQVLAQVQIPNIVRVIEFTEIDGMPCLVMDFVAGETLNECIRLRGYIPEDEAVKLFQKLAKSQCQQLVESFMGIVLKHQKN